METQDTTRSETQVFYDDCGASHVECPNGNGSCERAAGHDGSHRCSSCRSSF